MQLMSRSNEISKGVKKACQPEYRYLLSLVGYLHFQTHTDNNACLAVLLEELGCSVHPNLGGSG